MLLSGTTNAICQLQVRQCTLSIVIPTVKSAHAQITQSDVLKPVQALSPVGRCRTFDAAADGYGRGEGIAVIVMQPSGDSVQNTAEAVEGVGSGSTSGTRQPYAVVRGSVTNQGGRSGGLTAPNGPAQGALVR